ncbi:MAG: hypothetical protein Q8M93_04285 [Polaromonas sp.]|uniref:DUF6622 family protein n=1 Tax=Polaromonas sp. TaxID=1869339 RepID=UPI002731E8B1|nr:DUF6622 family protein [Polaromonas sp.]MDP2450801.1 hypothetical protein [Polaromonas sp.]MDP3246162.1 hypothetical protein [Polaromonas sp.]MDP3757788.1 hypothetical protein [Polaromonas sp.]
MLIQLLLQHPQTLGPVLKNTPPWVWGLLVALLALGLSQVRNRRVGALRMAIMPLAMTGLSLWGTASAFGKSPLFGYILLVWLAGALLMAGLIATTAPPTGTRHDAAGHSFWVPGSWLPLALILGIFLTKYIVGVDLAMQPQLAQDGPYTLVTGALYGVFSGIFAGRSLRLIRLALRPAAAPALPVLNA